MCTFRNNKTKKDEKKEEQVTLGHLHSLLEVACRQQHSLGFVCGSYSIVVP